MSEEEIVKINRKLEKMIDRSEVDESLAQDLLARLQETRMTLNILKKTSIGKTVNNLRRVTNNEQLTAAAKSLLKNWKKLVPDSGAPSTEKDETKPSNATPSSSQSSQEANPSDDKSKNAKKSAERKPSQWSVSSSSSSFSSSSQPIDDIRIKCREMLAGALSVAELPEGSADPVYLASRIEDAIFNEFKETNQKYRNRVRSRVANLKDLKNPNLRNSVLFGVITPERMATLTADEMASDQLKQERMQFNDKAINECQLSADDGVVTDTVPCKRCKKTNCSYSEVQTRSADEPMTLFFLCKTCGFRWKQ